jgi:hypothetical protein
LSNKNEVEKYVREFVPQAESRLNIKVSKIRCDNGGEHRSSKLIKLYKERVIEVDYTVPHTPQLNGKAERLNRSLMEKARSLFFYSKLKSTQRNVGRSYFDTCIYSEQVPHCCYEYHTCRKMVQLKT